jgi:hypothetical protein
MKNLISAKLAGSILIIVSSLLLLLHVLILIQIVPVSYLWNSQAEKYVIPMESLSLLLTLTFMAIIAGKMGWIKIVKFKLFNIGLWIVFVYLLLNVIDYLILRKSTENLIFAPFTVLSALLVYRLILEN